MEASNLESKLSDFVWKLDSNALPSKTKAALTLATIDCVASILSGVPEPVAINVVKYVTANVRQGPSRIIGNTERASLEGAALAHGAMGHACDYDDINWSMWGHSTAPVLPAILAIAEARTVSGSDLMAALLAGLEVETRLGAAIAPDHLALGWHPTSTLGIFGSAIATAKVIGLDRERTEIALGIAASHAAVSTAEQKGTIVAA